MDDGFAAFLSLVSAALFLLMFWRMMRAHERLAAAIEKFERVTRPGDSGGRPERPSTTG